MTQVRVTIIAIIFSCSAIFGVIGYTQAVHAAPSTTQHVTVNYQKSLSTVATKIGATYEHQGPEYSEDDAKKSDAAKLVKSSLSMQNRHIIGFGADNLWPDPNDRNPDNWNWSNLDLKVNEMRKSSGAGGAEIMLTLGMAPNWMTTQGGLDDYDGTQINPPYNSPSDYPDRNNDGEIDKYADNPAIDENIQSQSELEQAPDPWFVDDFAYMAAQVAKRYPDVKTFQVWNEFKGMYDVEENHWDYERYTTLYNKVWDAVKAERPNAKIGGPYLSLSSRTKASNDYFSSPKPECGGSWGVLDERDIGDARTSGEDSVMSYWLRNKHGADFLNVDFGTKITSGSDPDYDEFATSEKMHDVITCLQNVKDRDGTVFPDAKTLPIGISEYYPQIESDSENESQRAAVEANALGNTISNGYSYALLWDIQSSSCDPKNSASALTLYSNVYEADCNDDALRGKASALAPILQGIKSTFKLNQKLYKVTGTDASVGVFATKGATMIVNKTDDTRSISLDNCKPITLTSYEVQFVDKQNCMPPNAVDNLRASKDRNDIKLRWNEAESTNEAVVSYRLYRNGKLVKILDADTRSYVDTTAKRGVTYRYQLVAVDASGNQSERTASAAIRLSVANGSGSSGSSNDSQDSAPGAPNTGFMSRGEIYGLVTLLVALVIAGIAVTTLKIRRRKNS